MNGRRVPGSQTKLRRRLESAVEGGGDSLLTPFLLLVVGQGFCH